MNVLITGHSGFIASNLVRSFVCAGHNVVPHTSISLPFVLKTGEHCVFRNESKAWEDEFNRLGVDLVVHNAAVVGTDVVALNPDDATLSNVTGTYNICRAADRCNIPVLYLGTTVIYDTARYQKCEIIEDSLRGPTTLYGSLKLAGEHIVKSHCKKWAIARPLFCYGGVGDNNSLIAKGFFAAIAGKKDVDMFLDPTKVKDYMRVEDFCDAVALIGDRQLWGEDWNVSAETPHSTGDIINMMSKISGYNIADVVKWYPATDYLGNHRLSSQKFREIACWTPKYDLYSGLEKSWNDLLINRDSTGYNPLQYLEAARLKGLDLTQFFNQDK